MQSDLVLSATGVAVENKEIIEKLNEVLECELAGVVRYTHYSLMVFGHNRIPIVDWLRSQAKESLDHAAAAGEHITALGGHPSLKIGKLIESHKHSIGDILHESLDHEKVQLNNLKQLLEIVEKKSVYLEEFTRKMIFEEEGHISDMEKMMRSQVKQL